MLEKLISRLHCFSGPPPPDFLVFPFSLFPLPLCILLVSSLATFTYTAWSHSPNPHLYLIPAPRYLIIENFIPPEEKNKIMNRLFLDCEEEQWKFQPLVPSGA